MPSYGLLETGFSAKPATVIKAELDEALKGGPLGASAGTESDGSIPAASVAGQIVAIMTDALSALWEGQEAIHSAANPEQATGAALDAVCAITGTLRDAEASSTVDAVCAGTPGTALLTGRVATVETSGTRFASTADKTIAAATAWVALTAYVVGDTRTNASRIYRCIANGTSAGAGGPTTTAADITDATAHWAYAGEGTGYVDVPFEAEDTGPLGADTGTLNEIATPVSGWSSVRNLEDAELGADQASDAALRVQREAELEAQGNATADAIRADVLQVEGVTACRVFQNQTLVTDGDGLPGKSIEVLVLGGDDDAVAQAIWDSAGAGIETYGTTTETVTDDAGNVQTVKFTRPSAINIWIIVAVTKYVTEFPTDGSDQIEDAILALDYPIGKDVTAWAIGSPLDAIAGVLDVTSVLIGTADPPVASTTITIGARQIASLDSARITVNLSNGTP